MKKLIIMLLLCLIFFISNVWCQEDKKNHCDLMDWAARQEYRMTTMVGFDGKNERMIGVGECTDNGICVLSESFDACGGISQNIGKKENSECKFTLQWVPILDVKHGIVFGVSRIKPCPSII